MHIESRERFIHKKNMLLNPEYNLKYEEEQKLDIKHTHISLIKTNVASRRDDGLKKMRRVIN